MVRKLISQIAALLLLLALVGGLGWLAYAPIRQERLNHALIAAINQGQSDLAKHFLNEGADPNSRTPDDVPLPHRLPGLSHGGDCSSHPIMEPTRQGLLCLP